MNIEIPMETAEAALKALVAEDRHHYGILAKAVQKAKQGPPSPFPGCSFSHCPDRINCILLGGCQKEMP